MEQLPIPNSNITLFYEPPDTDLVAPMADALTESARLIEATWGFQCPRELYVYIMTSWLRFLFHSAPWFWKIGAVLSFPFWGLRIRSTWRVAGGWTQRFGSRKAVGVKPPRLMARSDTSLGSQIFIPEPDGMVKMRSFACHEMTHAFSSNHKLPVWLNEGLAMVTVDRYLGKATVREETLQWLAPAGRQRMPRSYRSLDIRDHRGVLLVMSRGYWLTRYLEEEQPGSLRQLFQARPKTNQYEPNVARLLGIEAKDFWPQVDRLLRSHFKEEA